MKAKKLSSVLLVVFISCQKPDVMIKNDYVDVSFDLPKGFSMEEENDNCYTNLDNPCFKYGSKDIDFKIAVFLNKPYPNYNIKNEFYFMAGEYEFMHHYTIQPSVDSTLIIRNHNWWNLELIDTGNTNQEKYIRIIERDFKDFNVRIVFSGYDVNRMLEYKSNVTTVVTSLKVKQRH